MSFGIIAIVLFIFTVCNVSNSFFVVVSNSFSSFILFIISIPNFSRNFYVFLLLFLATKRDF